MALVCTPEVMGKGTRSLSCRIVCRPCTTGRHYVTSFISAGSPGSHLLPNSPPCRKKKKKNSKEKKRKKVNQNGESHKLNYLKEVDVHCLLPQLLVPETKKYYLKENE